MKNSKELILENSTNSHKVKANHIESKAIGNGIIKLKIKGKGFVSHGEHGTVVTESENVIKYVQQELNPVTKAMQNAFD
tara:strand:- start:272 stop:508 length:237 start_codon:yes stop_codon:yes gene_type:complete